MKDISVIGCGRWGTFLAWYAANRCKDKINNVLMYDLKTSPNFIELRDTRKNEYLSLSDNMFLFDFFFENIMHNFCAFRFKSFHGQ